MFRLIHQESRIQIILAFFLQKNHEVAAEFAIEAQGRAEDTDVDDRSTTQETP